MKSTLHFISTVLFALIISTICQGQSDSLTRALNSLERQVADSTTYPVVVHQPGTVKIISSNAIDSLEKAQRGRSEIRGYRIQIFLGGLTEAKKERTKFISAFPNESCYVEQNIPDHAVRIGDFRNLPEAQVALREYKVNYPGAFIVKDKIDMPRLK